MKASLKALLSISLVISTLIIVATILEIQAVSFDKKATSSSQNPESMQALTNGLRNGLGKEEHFLIIKLMPNITEPKLRKQEK